MSSIGERLRKIRESLGLTQEQVAFTLDLTRNIIVNIENNKRSIKPEELYKFSKLYGINMEEIVSDDKELDLSNQLFLKDFDQLSFKDREEIINLIKFKVNYNKNENKDKYLTALEVANYFLSKDPKRKLFNKKVVTNNNRNSYEGNIRLNKYLFLAQVVYLARFDKLLFMDNFSAYDNGPVVKDIVYSYSRIESSITNVDISKDKKEFLDKIYYSLKDATIEELIDITHEDPEWQRLKSDTYNAPIMDIEKNIDEYKRRYKGLIEALKL